MKLGIANKVVPRFRAGGERDPAIPEGFTLECQEKQC